MAGSADASTTSSPDERRPRRLASLELEVDAIASDAVGAPHQRGLLIVGERPEPLDGDAERIAPPPSSVRSTSAPATTRQASAPGPRAHAASTPRCGDERHAHRLPTPGGRDGSELRVREITEELRVGLVDPRGDVSLRGAALEILQLDDEPNLRRRWLRLGTTGRNRCSRRRAPPSSRRRTPRRGRDTRGARP